MSQVLNTDVLIVGGGVAASGSRHACAARGFATLLVESASLGGGQSVKSQGIIHGGAKYALHGALTGASEAIADMPRRWRRPWPATASWTCARCACCPTPTTCGRPAPWPATSPASSPARRCAAASTRSRATPCPGPATPEIQGQGLSPRRTGAGRAEPDPAPGRPRRRRPVGRAQHRTAARGDELVGLVVDGRSIRAQRIVLSAGAGNGRCCRPSASSNRPCSAARCTW